MGRSAGLLDERDRVHIRLHLSRHHDTRRRIHMASTRWAGAAAAELLGLPIHLDERQLHVRPNVRGDHVAARKNDHGLTGAVGRHDADGVD